MFHSNICNLLRYYTENPPETEDVWRGPWLGLLNALFLPDLRNVVWPRGYFYGEQGQFEVIKYPTPDMIRGHTVLVVKVKRSQEWERGIPAIEHQIERLTNAALSSGDADSKVYWISAIGPHWRYGIHEEGQGPRPLIDWHDVTHDEASYADFQVLVSLVAALFCHQ